jgi:hypothetical protein
MKGDGHIGVPVTVSFNVKLSKTPPIPMPMLPPSAEHDVRVALA